MRIGIDASGLGGPKTGTSVYLGEILDVWNRDKSIAHDFVVFANNHAIAHLSGLGLDSRFRFVRAPSHRHLRALWQQAVLPLHLARHCVDVHWGAGFVLPLLSPKPMVLSVHDLTFQLFPQVHERIKRYYFPAMIRAGVRKARAVIAISESTRRDLHRLIPESIGKTTVTLLAPRRLGQPSELEAAVAGRGTDDHVLFVGTVEPRKNLPSLLDAWQSLDPAVRADTKLVVVGATGWMVEPLLRRLGTTDSIRFLGAVDDAQLAGLMQGAKAFLYPSLYEGFGLPVVEAMAAGTPVLTSDLGATREVAEGAAVLVDPTNVADMREGIGRLLSDQALRESLSSAGRERAARFSWARTAEETLAVIQRAAGV